MNTVAWFAITTVVTYCALIHLFGLRWPSRTSLHHGGEQRPAPIPVGSGGSVEGRPDRRRPSPIPK